MEKRVTNVQLIDSEEDVFDIEVDQDHSFIVAGVVAHNSDICRARAWKRWDADKKPIGHSLPYRQPPLHEHCRSRLQLIFLDDPQPEQLTFKSWVQTLTQAQQEKVFGKANIEAWKRGRIADADLIRQANRPMSIDELRERTQGKQGEFPFL